MTPERWQQIKALFHRAVSLASAQRASFLSEACRDDVALRSAVESLLQADDKPASWISRGVLAATPELLTGQDSVASRVGQRLGSYRIVREIDRGGMGAVYLAERDDDQYQESVAIKIVQHNLGRDSRVARFRRERQILAHLRHPHIARLLDGGVTPDGLPFLVMEYIEGLPLDHYCDAHSLSIRQRLKLFLDVCAAVSTAHQNLVVHRDLKPSNILVTAEGVTKLLDFGIAKLLDPEAPTENLTVTADLGWMTPEYASPEQVRGQPMTTASDVYSLGVVLYELLSGHRPYRFKSRRPQEIERVVCEQQPEKPSTAVRRLVRPNHGGPDKRHRRLSGDLDNIVLTAMAKEPSRRYSSVEQLADDLRNHLEGLPILASPNTWGYRAGKFMRRNWPAVLAASWIVASVLAGIAGTLWQASRATTAQRQAERVLEFVAGLFEASDPVEAADRDISVRELLDRGLLDLQQDLADEPAVKASLMRTMGVAYLHLGAYQEADELLTEALEIRQRTLGEAHEDVAEVLTEVGLLRFYEHDLKQAETLLHRGLETRRQILGDNDPAISESLNHLGLVREKMGDLEGAEELHRQALALRREVLGEEHLSVARSLHNLASVARARGQLETAEELFQQALELRREKLPEGHPTIASTLDGFALMLDEKGEPERAEELYREALEIRLQVLGEKHPRVATSLNNLASLLQKQQRYVEAEGLFRRALELNREALGAEHPRVTTGLNNLVAALVKQHRFAEAEPLLRELLARVRRAEAESERRPKTAHLLRTLAQVVRLQGQEEEAAKLADEARGLTGETR